MTCLSFFLVETLPQLTDALVHKRHFHIALVQKLLLLLQLAVLLLIQLVSNLMMSEDINKCIERLDQDNLLSL